MPSLRELVDNQKITGIDDISVIRDWFILNNCEQEGLTIISDLSKAKTDKLENKLNYANTWIPSVPDIIESNKGIDHIVGVRLNQIIRLHCLGSELPIDILNWAKDTIPTMDTPKIIFLPAVKWLKEKYQIEFRDHAIDNIFI